MTRLRHWRRWLRYSGTFGRLYKLVHPIIIAARKHALLTLTHSSTSTSLLTATVTPPRQQEQEAAGVVDSDGDATRTHRAAPPPGKQNSI